MTELKPCPFCGGEAELHGVKAPPMLFIVCKSCGAESTIYRTEKEAIAAWNTRAETATLYEDGFYLYDVKFVPERTCRMYRDGYGVWNCKACGELLDSWNDGWQPDYCPNCGAKVVGE